MFQNILRWYIETKHLDLEDQPLSYFEIKLREIKTSRSKLTRFININVTTVQSIQIECGKRG